jgi:hypothetical protein
VGGGHNGSLHNTFTFAINFDQTVAGVNNGQFDGSPPLAVPLAGDLDADAWTFVGSSNFRATSAGDVGQGSGDAGFYSFDIEVWMTLVPEPESLALLLCVGAVSVFMRRRSLA